MIKTLSIAVSVFVLSLMATGCNSTIRNPLCNVSVGPTKGIVLHGNKCAYPGLVTLPDGNLLTSFICPNATAILELSRDKGASWEPRPPIIFNDTSEALSLLSDGTLFLSSSIADASGKGVPMYMVGTIGADDQITWSSPQFVTTPAWSKGCWAVAPVVQLGDRNLLWPAWCNSNNAEGWPGSSTVLLSSDGGVTWPRQVTVGDGDADHRDYDESAALVFPSGDIVMIIRHTNNVLSDRYGTYWRSKSSDGGHTWSAPTMVANATFVGRPTLALLPSGGLVLLSRAGVSGISRTGFATSWDMGLTFSYFGDLGVGEAGTDNYDAMSMLPDGSVAVVTVHSTNSGTASNVDYRNLLDKCSPVLVASQRAYCAGALEMKR